jgi:hypothetical protein
MNTITKEPQGAADPNYKPIESLCGWCGTETNLTHCPKCGAHKLLDGSGVWYKEHDTRGRIYRQFKDTDFAAAKAMEQQLMQEYGGYYSGRFSVFKQSDKQFGDRWIVSGSYGTSD